MSTLKHAAFLGLVSVIMLAAAAFGGAGCPLPDAPARPSQDLYANHVSAE